MYNLATTNKFRRDLKRCQKQQKDMAKFKAITRLLEAGENLPIQNRDHSLSGNWSGFRECHIEPDWLLIYEIDDIEKTITLTRIGSHSELF